MPYRWNNLWNCPVRHALWLEHPLKLRSKAWLIVGTPFGTAQQCMPYSTTPVLKAVSVGIYLENSGNY